MILENRYKIVAIIAFIAYTLFNFFYLRLETYFGGDDERFIREAITLVEIGQFKVGEDRAWEMPLTALIYAFFYSIFETKESLIVLVRLFQSILLILSAFLISKISIKIFKNELSAFLAFLVTLFYPYLVFYQGMLLSEMIFIFLLIGSFYFLYSWFKDDFKFNKNFFLTMLFLTLSIYTKGTLSLLPPFLVAGFCFINRFNFIDAIKIFIFSTLLYSLFLSPWWIRNYIIFEKFVPFTTSSGVVLYVGNNSGNLNGGCDVTKDVEFEIYNKIAKTDDELERSNLYKLEAIKFIKDDFNRFLELALLKFQRFYAIIPNADGFNQGLYKWASIFSYGLIFPLFLVSIIYFYKIYKSLSAILILFAYFTLLHMVFISSLRYRLPLEPFMILLSTAFIGDLKNRLDRRKNGNY